MENFNMTKHTSFYAIGLSYKKADAAIRGKFSLDTNAKSTLLMQAEAEGIESLIVTSTCNRTEIYGFANHPYELIKLLCENSQGTVEEFQEVAYIYKNQDAVSHMFRVGTGLDSQILGDFEIISQLKIAFIQSKSNGLVNSFMERLLNSVIQASKKIKTDTEISTGATSVSFASVQYIIKNVEDIANKNILLTNSAAVNTKPQLEIWADDVKCSHGCTVGRLDEEGMFYLRSRGINEKIARSLLIHAFAIDILEHIKPEVLRNYVDQLISERLEFDIA